MSLPQMLDGETVNPGLMTGASGYKEEYRNKIVTSIKEAFLYHPTYKVFIIVVFHPPVVSNRRGIADAVEGHIQQTTNSSPWLPVWCR